MDISIRMRVGKFVLTATALLICMLSVVPFGCKKSPPKAGRVVGVLYYPDGRTFASGVKVFAMNHAAGRQHADLKYETDSKGTFILDELQPGKYYLWVLIPPKPEIATGTDNLPEPTIGYVVNKNERLSFEVPGNGGLDLGNVEVTSIEPP
jgi:hypothetical protein